MRLLITGGAGFIGSNLIHHIIGQPEVERLVNLDCLTYAGHLENLEAVSGHPKYRFEKVDLRDKPAVQRVVGDNRITHVMHLAAESHVDRSIDGPGDFVHTNIVGTFNLLEACRSAWLNTQLSTIHYPLSINLPPYGPAFTSTCRKYFRAPPVMALPAMNSCSVPAPAVQFPMGASDSGVPPPRMR